MKPGVVFTAETDPNRLLGHPTGYLSMASFTDSRIPAREVRNVAEDLVDVGLLISGPLLWWGRPGASWLRVADVDFLRRTVRIEHQSHGVTRQLVQPKTTSSLRTIPLPAIVADALAAHLAEHPPGPDIQ